MGQTLCAITLDQLEEALVWANHSTTRLEVQGTGTRAGLGNPVDAGAILDMGGFGGIDLYEPDELVLTAGAATPLREIKAALSKYNQHLPFSPFHPAFALHGDTSDTEGGTEGGTGGDTKGGSLSSSLGGSLDGSLDGSLGGMVATGLAGPRRFRVGSTRDFVLGIEGVTGRGKRFKAGGRVVKNVTGYDLPKLMTGSYGTLAALTRITLKVLPKPVTSRTMIIPDISLGDGLKALMCATASSGEPTGAAYVPGHLTACLGDFGKGCAFIRFEGTEGGVAVRISDLYQKLGVFTEVLESDTPDSLWRRIGSARTLPYSPERDLWRITLPPSDAQDFIRRNQLADYSVCWGGGLIWASPSLPDWTPANFTGSAICVRRAHPDTPFMLPQSPAIRHLARRVKDAFDPNGILNPGKLYGDF